MNLGYIRYGKRARLVGFPFDQVGETIVNTDHLKAGINGLDYAGADGPLMPGAGPPPTRTPSRRFSVGMYSFSPDGKSIADI